MAKILVIEDEAGVRDSIVDILNAEDFIVDSAANGEEGLRQIHEFKPDMVICDVMMPVLDGFGVLKQIRQDPGLATLPFVFLTAKAERVDFRSGMDLGADDYLTKPFTHDDLLRMIHTRLEANTAVEHKTQQQLSALRSSISIALPRELGAPMKEVLKLATTLIEKAATLEPEEIVTLARAIHRNSHRTARLTQNMMLFAKLERLSPEQISAETLQHQHTDRADEVITQVAQALASDYLRDDDLEISLEHLAVPMSEAQLRKVCEELLDNAFKFSEVGTPIKIFGSCGDGKVTFYVIDYGQGMTSDQIAQVGAYLQFEPESEATGTGLGLTIAKRLVELHRGKVLIESIPGQQTIVRVALPD
ncbi:MULTISPECIES: response regulator [Cyanophyceae]|uniref:hybrid sensor histidine kinase/response regulator n=1 Tax=Cyanophyceae TaxID=3028117 RepID=UPI001683DDA8|nr:MULTISPECIES: response regulator [Cyanophyceae]MBD1914585.1 response regulator [Phormidium sp. FACHB-77]MBD2030309.1 response regulator [Phormidium sp. FACHB-322]MBD2049855.1 response regulator [Leptolyngbya sp. FACHB-60]